MILWFLSASMTEFSALIRISGLICSPTLEPLCADTNQQNVPPFRLCLKEVLRPVSLERGDPAVTIDAGTATRALVFTSKRATEHVYLIIWRVLLVIVPL